MERQRKVDLRLKLAAATSGLFVFGGAATGGYFAYEGNKDYRECEQNLNSTETYHSVGDCIDGNKFLITLAGSLAFVGGTAMAPIVAIEIEKRKNNNSEY